MDQLVTVRETHSSMLLSILDRCSVALCPRVGDTDRAYVVWSPELLKLLSSVPNLQLRSVNAVNASSIEKFSLYPRGRGRDINYVCLDHESSYSAIQFYLSYLEVLIDSVPKILELPSISLATLCEPFIWLCDVPSEHFVVYAKYLTAYPMARFMKNRPPSIPSGFPPSRQLLFTGVIKNIIRNRLISYDRRNAKLFWGILQGVKRGAAKVPDSFIDATLRKHMTALTALGPHRISMVSGTWGDQADYEDYRYDFEKKTFNIFNKFIFDEALLDRSVEPSWNASFEYKRHEGGQRMDVIDQLSDVMEWEKSDRPQVLTSPDSSNFNSTELASAALRQPELLSIYNEPHGSFEFFGTDFRKPLRVLLSQILKGDLPLPDKLTCKVIPIIEPLKVRTITTGDGVYYYLAKALQLALWKHLKSIPQFILISESMSKSHLYDILEQEYALDAKLPVRLDFTDWVSGDYSGATDGVDGQFTRSSYLSAIEASLKANPSLKDYFELCGLVIGNHNMVYTVVPGSKTQELASQLGADLDYSRPGPNVDATLPQRTGQLMGSPLSFPFLCTINVVAYWIALEKYLTSKNGGKPVKVKLRDLPVRVNGDDICFRANSTFYEYWKESVKMVGFSLSLGKNYIHPRLVTINSKMYEYTFWNGGSTKVFNPSDHTFHQINYLNSGLLMGQSKLTGRESTRNLPLWEIYRAVVEGATDRPRAHQRFIHYNLDLVNRLTLDGKFNLFMPRWLGGLGFPIFDEVFQLIEFTPFQRRFATFLKVRIAEELALGVFPLKYLTALVTEDEAKAHLGYVRKVEFPMGLFPVGPLPPGVIEYKKFEVSPRPLTVIVHMDQDKLSAPLKVRYPSRSLLREFTRAFTTVNVTHDVRLSQISNDEIFLFSDLRIGVLPLKNRAETTSMAMDDRDYIVSTNAESLGLTSALHL